MTSEIERFKELGRLTRAGYAELGALQLQLMEAYERKLDPAQLGARIADLGRDIAAWKLEQKVLFRNIASDGAPEPESSRARSFILDRLTAQQGQTARGKQTQKRDSAAKGSKIRKQIVA